jgi:A/G-specific adenine glycosylase
MAIERAPIPARTVNAIQRALHQWYLDNRRDLPWRRTQDPFAIWVSEVMLQQTQVKTALPYYERFMEAFPTVQRLADATMQAVLKAWEGLGYYSRARNLHRAATIVASQMDGRLPRDWPTFKRLPGVGDYIAAAVLSIAFGRPYAVADGNVKRVLARLFLIDVPVNQAAGHKVFQTTARQLLSHNCPGDHNQAVMELGALVCTPRKPACDRCPLKRFCGAAAADRMDRYPLRVKTDPTPQHRLVCAVVVKNGRLLLTQRPSEGLLGGLWEFPNGPWKNGEKSTRACVDMVRSVVGLDAKPLDLLTSVRHAYSHFKIQMAAFHCRWQSGRVRLNGLWAFRWVPLEKLAEFPMHGAVQKIVPHLEKMMRRTSSSESSM